MDEEPVKCDLYKRCLNVRFFKRRLELNVGALDTFKNNHCFSNNYQECLFYPKLNGLIPRTLSELSNIQRMYYKGNLLK